MKQAQEAVSGKAMSGEQGKLAVSGLPRTGTAKDEHHLTVAVASFLDVALPADCRAFHVPNGGARSPRTGARLKREGVKRGVPDFMIVMAQGKCAMIELKTYTGRLSDAQKDWQAWADEWKLPFAVCHSVEEVAAALQSFGIKLKAVGFC